MLPSHHRQRYEQFKRRLEQLNQAISNEGAGSLKAIVTDLQNQFETQILSLESNELTAAMAHQVQSYQVELDKQLRLLGIDVTFLQAARQAATVEQRQTQMGDRVKTLIRYCDALLEGEE